MILTIVFIFLFMLIIIARNKNNTFAWIFTGMFASLDIIFISMIFYIIKLSNYYSVFDIENVIFMMMTKVNMNFFHIHMLVNFGVVLFMTSKLLIVSVFQSTKANTKKQVVFILICVLLGVLYMFFNSFTVSQKLFIIKNSTDVQNAGLGRVLTYIFEFYNIALFAVSFILPYVAIISGYKNTPLSFKKKQYAILTAFLGIIDLFFALTFIFGPFKGKVINNIELENFTVYGNGFVNKYYIYFSTAALIVINIFYIILARYRIFDRVSFFRNRLILKNTKVLPTDIRNVTHSYKNSIFAIMALCDEIEEDYKSDGRLSSITGQINKISRDVLSQLETFANLTNSDIKKVSETDIQSCIDDAVSRLTCGEIAVEKNYFTGPVYILAERSQIVEAIYNILVNSVEAINISGKKDGKIKISLYSDSDWVCISIWDNGCGIEKKNIKKLYNPLFSTKKTNKNWGIGLSYSYKVIKAHLGIIFCDSVFGEYTEFQILLPGKYSEKHTIW